MTSNEPKDCFVYITLPGQTSPVTCGRFELQTTRQGVPEGRFVYGRSYLNRAEAVPLDPIELKLDSETFFTNRLNGVFGALRDASPDYWGRRIIQKHLGQTQPGELQYLLNSPDDRAGALGFGLNQEPPAPKRQFNQTLDLEVLQATADAIAAEEDVPANAENEQVAHLMQLGTSMGGARPKAVVESNDCLWVAKFNTSTDTWNNARVEHAMLVLARECGLTTADSRVVQVANRDVLLVKRFDRDKKADGYTRARMISALTLLRTEDNHRNRERWSYILLAEELRRVCENPKENAAELFRRMTFNALISNVDDHPRNHALIAMDKNWKLSPAYDLTPAPLISLEHRDLAMECGNQGRYANAANLLSQSARFLLDHDEATAIIDTIEDCVRKRWYPTARSAGVSETDCNRIAGAFAYQGFRQTENPS